MLDLLKLRLRQGYQAIPDVQKAQVNKAFRGFPLLQSSQCAVNCHACANACPTQALQLNPLRIDLGTCIFCGDCAIECTTGAVQFSNNHKLATSSREALIVSDALSVTEFEKKAVEVREEIIRIFGRSLKLRQVSAAGCNACEMELNACGNVNFDMGRFGIDFVASPRHADGVVITGPVSENMAYALEDTYRSLPEPRIVIAVGTCAISGGVFAGSPALDRSFFDHHKVDLYIPGCPIHPLTFVNGVLAFLGRKKPA